MTNQTHTLVAWLRDAHAMERATVDTLDQIAPYISLGAAARKLEEPAIVQMCEENLQQERAMASWLEQQIPEAALDFLRA